MDDQAAGQLTAGSSGLVPARGSGWTLMILQVVVRASKCLYSGSLRCTVISFKGIGPGKHDMTTKK